MILQVQIMYVYTTDPLHYSLFFVKKEVFSLYHGEHSCIFQISFYPSMDIIY